MKVIVAKSLRTAAASTRPQSVLSCGHALAQQRRNATHDSLSGGGAATSTAGQPGPRRRAVTPFNDDGHVPWTELSAGEKTARAAQQTFNVGLVVLGIVLTGTVGYFLYQDVFSTDSKVAYFNRAVSRIRKDPRCVQVLGDSKKLSAYGEETWNKWRRARPIASTLQKDQFGNDHLMMHFHVEGPKNKGTARLHLTRKAGEADYQYKYFYVDVPGQPRIYLERADEAAMSKGSSDGKGFTLFGVKWT